MTTILCQSICQNLVLAQEPSGRWRKSQDNWRKRFQKAGIFHHDALPEQLVFISCLLYETPIPTPVDFGAQKRFNSLPHYVHRALAKDTIGTMTPGLTSIRHGFASSHFTVQSYLSHITLHVAELEESSLDTVQTRVSHGPIKGMYGLLFEAFIPDVR